MNNNEAISTGCFAGIKLPSFLTGRNKQLIHPVSTPSVIPNPKGAKDGRDFLSPSRDFNFGSPSEWWLSENSFSESTLPPYTSEEGVTAAERTIEVSLNELDLQLYNLSITIHGHPELGFQERFARDTLTAFMRDHGFKVTLGYLGLETAWRAEFSHGTGGKVVGINSEMDALAGIGHACGHNLIAASGCGIAIALKAALQAHNIPGKIILLGTPAEEGGGGKIILLERGGYDEMDFCVMSHPGPGPQHAFDIGTSNAVQTFEVEYLGKGAHAGASPWEGVNALDAAFLAYSSISVLRQQMKPTHRSHGIVKGRDWISNVIPDNASLRWQVRAPTFAELTVMTERVRNCFEAAALATGCTVQIDLEPPYYDLKQNTVLAKIFSEIVQTRYTHSVSAHGSPASTDFGNVSYYLPALHPMYSIPTVPNGGNHTPAFTKAAKSKAAHAANMISTRGLAITALRVLQNDDLFQEMKASFA